VDALRPDLGHFVRLGEGRCHYRVDGPPDGPVVLLIHGATVPGWEFDRFVPLLSAAGYRSIRPDLYGHGLSDRPRVHYGHALFVRQLIELLDALGVDSRLHLLGHSLGAALTARLVHAQPDRFASAVLCAPLVNYVANVPATRALAWPVLGECLMRAYVMPMLRRRRRRKYAEIDGAHFSEMFAAQLRIPGFERALLSMFRHGALGEQRDCYERLGVRDLPVLALRGGDDPIVTSDQMQILSACLPRARLEEIPGAAHGFLLSHPERVADLIIGFLRATAGGIALATHS